MEPEAAVDFVRSLAREHREKDVDLVLERQESLAVRVHKGRVEKVDQSTARGPSGWRPMRWSTHFLPPRKTPPYWTPPKS